MTGDWLKDYKERHYLPDKVIVSLAGSYSDEVVEEIRRRFSSMTPGKAANIKAGRYTPAISLKRKATEQNHLILAFPAIDNRDDRRFTLQLLSSILGGGMSSRLFQQVREQQGLCYNIYTYGSSFADIGIFCIATAQSKDTEMQAVAGIKKVIDEFLADGATEEELHRVRELAKANVLMGMESTTAHMNHMARSVLNGEEILTPDEIIAAYDAVTLENLKALAEEMFRWENASLSVVGKVAEEETYRELIYNR